MYRLDDSPQAGIIWHRFSMLAYAVGVLGCLACLFLASRSMTSDFFLYCAFASLIIGIGFGVLLEYVAQRKVKSYFLHLSSGHRRQRHHSDPSA